MENNNCRILVIDDNRDIFSDFQAILVEQEGNYDLDKMAADYFGDDITPAPRKDNYELHYAPQGRDGVDLVKHSVENDSPFALAFVDMRMPPGWDGLETIEHMWKVDSSIQVVICTAYSDYSQGDMTDRIGKTDKLLILKKPFDTSEVAQLASALTEKWNLLKKASIKMSEIENMVELRTKALRDSLEELKSTQARLVQTEKMAALGNLVAGVAHEINTPLGVGITAASFLNEKTEEYVSKYKNEGLKRSELEKYTGIASESSAMILTNLNRAADLVKSFKLVAVDQSTDERRKFNLKEYLDKLLFSLEPNFKRTKHTVTLNCPEDLVISSYPGIFSQIITNLMMNSLVHGFKEVDDGKIKIDIYKEENRISLCYTDNGMGMDTETLEKVFDPFFTTNRSSGGTGLGIHILYNLVTQSLGGQMECTSTPEKGVVFLIRIPCD
jgi:signal transduction histidine kinase